LKRFSSPRWSPAGVNQNRKVITTLFKAGTDINTPNKDGRTPLMLAAETNKNPEVITTLLRAGADIENTDKNGYTPLLYAASKNNPEVITMLLKAGFPCPSPSKLSKRRNAASTVRHFL